MPKPVESEDELAIVHRHLTIEDQRLSVESGERTTTMGPAKLPASDGSPVHVIAGTSSSSSLPGGCHPVSRHTRGPEAVQPLTKRIRGVLSRRADRRS